MEFWGYYRALRRRRWIIAAAFFVAVAVAVLVNRPTIGDYASTATLSIPSRERVTFVTGAADPLTVDTGDPNARTALALSRIRSREVADRVVQQLGLTMHPDDLIRRISPVKDPISDLIKVTVTGSSPQDAITLANAVAETASAYDREVQRREATLAREFIEKQAQGTRSDLQTAEKALLAFQQRNGLDLAVPKSAQAAGLANDMQNANVSLQEIQAKLSAVLGQMNGQSAVRSDRQISDNPIAQQLRGELVQLEVALTSELGVHTERYPTVVALKTKIDAIKDRLKTELSKVVASEQIRFNPVYDALSQNRINLETEKLALLARKEALQQAMNAAERAMPGLAEKQMEQTRLTRNLEVLSKQFADLQGQLAQTRIREQQVQNLGSLAVVDHARTAILSPFGGLRFKLTLAAVLGLMGGIGLAFFLEYLDNTLKTPEQAERLLGVPALATIPRHNPPFDEAYRLLRINLGPHGSATGADAIVLTGLKPTGGTSTVVANLARAFARAGRRTIVVDADLRRPTQHHRLGVVNGKGLIEVLAGEISVHDALVQTEVPNLSLLPSGTATMDVGGLLGAPAMTGLLDELKRVGDVILVDAPPAAAFSDVLALAPLMSGVVLVLDAGRVPRGAEKQVKVNLDRLGAKIWGVVLTKVRPDLVDSYYYQTRFYRSPSRRRLAPAAATAASLIIAGVGLLSGVLAGHEVSKWFSAQEGRPAVHHVTQTQGQHTVPESVAVRASR